MDKRPHIQITFLGGAGTVTGSKYLIEIIENKLLVDCGLFQGLKQLRQLNWDKLPADASTISHVLLTHGHLDHVGYLPLLVKQGFKGAIYTTQPTIEVTKVILKDSAKIQEEDAERANRYRYSKHKPARPLYDTEEAEAVFPFLMPKPVNQWVSLFPGVSFRFRQNGHIIGSVFIELDVSGKLWVFSGDVGRENDPLMRRPERPGKADLLFLESTYGNRIHPSDTKQKLADALQQAIARNGTIIIPSFAVERAQLLLYYLSQLRAEKLIPEIPVYFDSPMGSEVLHVFHRNIQWLKLSKDEFTEMCAGVNIVQKQEETERLAKNKSPKIIIAGSGMAAGGRVLTYFEHYLADPAATILIVGYQGEGTRGRAMLEGASEIKMQGKYWPLKASVVNVQGLSAHADQRELLNWLSDLKTAPEKIFIVHGEKAGSEALQKELKATYGYESILPQLYQTFQVS
jgi:metallo-beta-lactamase family protein